MKIVALASGGLDSTVLLYSLKREGHSLASLGINYGQRHKRELDCAREINSKLAIEYRVLELPQLNELFGSNSLTDMKAAVPHGHYAEPSMKQTVVPNRNMVMLSLAASWALSRKFEAVAYAAHAGDHTIYPDCREEFARALYKTLALCDWQPLKLLYPFVNLKKFEIVKLGAELQVPFEKTWSCYQGGELHCGRCGTCVERREAFKLASVSDPTIYA